MSRRTVPVRHRATWDPSLAYEDAHVPAAEPMPDTPVEGLNRAERFAWALFGVAWAWTAVGLAIVLVSGGFPR